MDTNPVRVYGLSFVLAQLDKGIKRPRIVCVVDATIAPEVDRRIQLTRDLYAQCADAIACYLRESRTFQWKNDGRFGFRGCGVRTESGGEVYYAVELSGRSRQVALTLTTVIDACTAVLGAQAGNQTTTNRQQLLVVRPSCSSEDHPVTGWVYPALRKWLAQIGKQFPEPEGFGLEMFRGFALPPAVREAMVQAWNAVAPRRARRFRSDCYAGVTNTGRFQLACMGNSCDVSIYPEMADRIGEDQPVVFGCHNLDTSFQLVTLLAGLAAMHDLAVKDAG